MINLHDEIIWPEALKACPYKIAKKYQAVPLMLDLESKSIKSPLLVAMAEELNEAELIHKAAKLSSSIKREVKYAKAPKKDIKQKLKELKTSYKKLAQ